MPLRLHNVLSRAPILLGSTLWSTVWTMRPPKLIKNLASLLSTWFSGPWFQFWWALSVSDQTSFGFWVRHRTDNVVGKRQSSFDKLWELNDGFKFPTLDAARQIRLVSIQPSDDLNSPIFLTNFQNVSLGGNVLYSALSYNWGVFEQAEQAVIDGVPFRISPNLAIALRQLRAAGFQSPLWCDAICIKQDDLEEQALQVPLMAQIYGNASEVIVWLGLDESGPGTIWGLETVDYLINEKGPMHEPPWKMQDASIVRKSLEQVLTRPWFKRVWTVQELALARKVRMCIGHQAITWTDRPRSLRRAIQRMKYAEISPEWDENSMPSLDYLVDLLQMQMTRGSHAYGRQSFLTEGSLLDMLHRVKKSQRECYDPRDKVFALFGLVPLEELRNMKVDYSRSVAETYAELYSRVEVQDDELSSEDESDDIQVIGHQRDRENLLKNGLRWRWAPNPSLRPWAAA